MIPIRLNMRNFMCYTDIHEALEFNSFHTACLSGPNGHGKSTLLDAMTWALWGRARARTADELVHQGPNCNEMEVEFEFRLGEQHYRVIRKRNKRGRGASMLELGVRENGHYSVLTGNSVGDTERQIEQLLRMSYETFTNSSFILQGKADSFTTKTPAERKQILAEILDLSYYDRLEERARRKAAESNEQQTALQQQIVGDDVDLQRQPELRQQRQTLEAELARMEQMVRVTEAECEALRERLNRLKAGERELREQRRRLEEASSRAERQRALVAAAEAALERARVVLAREVEIEQGHVNLLQARKELERLSSAQAEYSRLSEEAGRLEQALAQARGQLEGRREHLRGQVAAMTEESARISRHQAELTAAKAECSKIEQLEKERATLEAQLAETRERFAEAKAHYDQHKEQANQLRLRQELLGASPTCPVCQTALGAGRQRDVLAHYRKEEKEIADLARKRESEMREIERSGKSVKAKLAGLEQLPSRRKVVQARLTQAERVLAGAQEQVRALERTQQELQRVEAELKGAHYARVEQRALKLIKRQITSLNYDPAHHKAIADATAKHANYESLRTDLLEARRSVVREQAAKEEAQRGLAEWETEALAAEKRGAELEAETRDLPRIDAEANSVDKKLRELRQQQGHLNQDLGAVRQHLNTMEFTAQRRAERLAELQRVLVEKSVYQELAHAFGKKGLQAMLIETAIPEIQDEANRLLGLMTESRMHVSLETQRAAKSGDTVETLDIKINDELGTRAYELYSGGEAFRVNFAIRIALSKLLARRAGARLQTLVIDEGFGSQDEQGRERLVEAIRIIQPEFEKILVITHLTDLKDLFPARIDISKTPAGSLIEVN